MKSLFQRLRTDFGPNERRDEIDPLLTASQVLLWVLLVGAILALIANFIAIAAHLAIHGSGLLVHPANPVWEPVFRRLFTIGAIWIAADIARQVLTMIGAVERDEVFAAENPARMEKIAWGVIKLQVLGFFAAVVGTRIGGDINGFDVGLDFSPASVTFALLLFILARVFRQGAALREDMAGTV